MEEQQPPPSQGTDGGASPRLPEFGESGDSAGDPLQGTTSHGPGAPLEWENDYGFSKEGEGDAIDEDDEEPGSRVASAAPPRREESGKLELPNPKRDRVAQVVHEECPKSYLSNLPEEELVLEFADNFRRQFCQLYPERRELVLYPQNECGVPKFVCTTIRPTQISYAGIYDVEQCARFVADHVTYEPLHNPLNAPEILPSPTAVLNWQVADCFDFSILLVSCLIGVGYDAYCVSGYAPRSVTLMDETKTEFSGEPVSKKWQSLNIDKKNEVEETFEPYNLGKRPQLDSVFLKSQEEKKRQEEAEAKAKAEAALAGDGEQSEDANDPLLGQRVHSWVLVLPGKRDVMAPVFVEPATGRLYSMKNNPYLGIESIWNSKNYWVNMQVGVLPGEVQFELDDTTKWEHVFVMTHTESTEAQTQGDDEDNEQSRAVVNELTVADDQQDPDQQVLEIPPSWVEVLEISREMYQSRCPEGTKTSHYHKVTHEMFAPYKMENGLVSRVTTYNDAERTDAKEIVEKFEARKDKLQQRKRQFAVKREEQMFCPGRPDGLKMIIDTEDRREMHMFPSARLDGLVTHIEIFGVKVMETFTQRDDKLMYRSVSVFPGSVKSDDTGTDYIRKMAEKYERDESVNADKDVRKRTFDLANKTIRLDYHYGEGRITAASRVYNSTTGAYTDVTVDPFAKPPKNSFVVQEFQELIVAEKECTQAHKESEREMQDILNARDTEEKNVTLVFSVYDLALRKGLTEETKDAAEEEAEAQAKADYLAPFLPKHHKGKLTKEQCQEVKEACLKDLKKRIMDRNTIIDQRLEAESANLTRRQTAHQRNRDTNEKGQAEEEYEKFVHEATFRISILKSRKQRHEDISKEKFKALVEKLHTDGRLSALHEPGPGTRG